MIVQVICGEKREKTEVSDTEPEHPKFNEASPTFALPVFFHFFSEFYRAYFSSLKKKSFPIVPDFILPGYESCWCRRSNI